MLKLFNISIICIYMYFFGNGNDLKKKSVTLYIKNVRKNIYMSNI